ncbi:MAG: VCBS repeat-containing protein, partial [candidate division NC10 bacterium]|nr:VCBS repeat-containing protein [candidate division NC10 bacterium]
GTVSVFLNQGTDANPVLAAGVTLSLPGVGVSRAGARPFVADWNQDGRQDLLVGDANGWTYVFLNAGTDGAPAFPTGAPLTGQGAPVAVSSRAAPFVVDWDSDGSRDLVIGSNDGEVFLIQGPEGPASGGGGGAGAGAGCFIATAAYGSAMEPQVVLLRAFRDEFLMTNHAGRVFVQWYYRASPPLAARIGQSPSLRGLVRVILWPLVGLAWLTLHPAVGSSVLVGAGGITGWIGHRRRKSRPTQP